MCLTTDGLRPDIGSIIVDSLFCADYDILKKFPIDTHMNDMESTIRYDSNITIDSTSL